MEMAGNIPDVSWNATLHVILAFPISDGIARGREENYKTASMIAQSGISIAVRRCPQGRALCCARQFGKSRHAGIGQRRSFSTTKPETTSNSTTLAGSEKPVLSGLTDELDRIAPRFDIDGRDIEILKEPSDFFEALKVGAVMR